MIIITGITGGIGNALYKDFKNNTNEKVIGIYKTEKEEKYSNYVLITDFENNYKVDITNEDEVTAFEYKIRDEHDRNIVLINCSGINYNSYAHLSDLDKWKKVIDVNLFGTFNMIRAFLPVMRENEYGRIINISSILSDKPVKGTSAYSASKAGLNGMIGSIAQENAKYGVTINNINLGYFNIGMTYSEIASSLIDKIEESIPAQRFGNTEELYKLINTIIQTEYINGSIIDIDGGL